MELATAATEGESANDLAISLVVCTRNRAVQLSKMLNSLTRVVGVEACDIIIVDNNSHDSTSSVIEEFKRTFAPHLKHLYEPRNGSSNAKNCGWHAAQGDIIAFTDDDCYPDTNYLESIKSCFREDDRLGYVGGRVLLHDPTDLRITLREHNERVEIAEQCFVEAGLIIGANFAFRRKALEEAKGFDGDFGAGKPFFAEDVDILTRISAKGWRGAYDPRPIVFHAHGRKTINEARRLAYQYDHGRGAYYAKSLLMPELRTKCAGHWQRKMRGQRPAVTLRELLGAMHYLSMRATRLGSPTHSNQ